MRLFEGAWLLLPAIEVLYDQNVGICKFEFTFNEKQYTS